MCEVAREVGGVSERAEGCHRGGVRTAAFIMMFEL